MFDDNGFNIKNVKLYLLLVMMFYMILNVKVKIEFKWNFYYLKDFFFNEDIIMKLYYMLVKFCVGFVLCLKCL